MKELFLLRGLPGSGKSTLAKSISEVYYEADMYFVDADGNYNFDGKLLKAAHDWCQLMTRTAMEYIAPKIVVSNTFTQEWEMDAYREMAQEHGYTVFSLVVENRHGGVNEHGVPEEALDRMEDRFELKLR
jgi:predicted kinase